MKQLSDLQQRQFGLVEAHLREIKQADRCFLLDAGLIQPWQELQCAAAKQGFDLQMVSGFRGFDRQLHIWQAKAGGRRELLDDQGLPLVFDALTPKECLQAIMRWSAVPGLSRHHWGSDLDVFDANVMDLKEVQLVPEEVEPGGVFSPLHQWLDEVIQENQSLGFYRPYHLDAGGVAPERWHLSFLPVAKQYMGVVEKLALLALWETNQLLLLNLLEADFDALYSRYVTLSLAEQPTWVRDFLGAD
ncbi:MAG: M15 family metallopeptidase [Pseudomonadales bacterium]|nr:M15 family metallopeptidase [Pseudomonadales bacterium]